MGSRICGWGVCALLLFASACDADPPPSPDAGGSDAGTDAGEPGPDPLRADCEALVPEVCAMPWPSSYFLAEAPTGRRIELGATTIPSSGRRVDYIDATALRSRDGFSVNATLYAYFPEATPEGLVPSSEIERSLGPSSPTVLVDATTGERVPHFSEIDASFSESPGGTLIIHPAAPLEHDRRYIVAVRDLVDASGARVEPREIFRALRDGETHEHAYVAARGPQLEDAFTILETAGVSRAGLQLAWDFHTASQGNDVGWAVSARDQALAVVGAAGPALTIDRVEEDVDTNILRVVHGSFEAPLFLDGPGMEARLRFDADGAPEASGSMTVPFTLIVPRSVTADAPGLLVQYGHGLFGNHTQVAGTWVREVANRNGWIVFAVDWLGMSETDIATITIAFSQDLAGFAAVPERLVQGAVNQLVAMRAMRSGLADLTELQDGGRTLVDTAEGHYFGHGQGGTLGATYMALSTDVTRGVLSLAGQPRGLLFGRSVAGDPYAALLRQQLSTGPAVQVAMGYMQELWDRADAGSFSRHITSDPLPGTPAHQVLLHVAIGSHQTTPLGAHVMARAIGASTVAPQTRAVFGITEASPPVMGSAMVELDFGLPAAPDGNTPLREGTDPSDELVRLPSALERADGFLRTGEVVHTCDGPCDPE